MCCPRTKDNFLKQCLNFVFVYHKTQAEYATPSWMQSYRVRAGNLLPRAESRVNLRIISSWKRAYLGGLTAQGLRVGPMRCYRASWMRCCEKFEKGPHVSSSSFFFLVSSTLRKVLQVTPWKKDREPASKRGLSSRIGIRLEIGLKNRPQNGLELDLEASLKKRSWKYRHIEKLQIINGLLMKLRSRLLQSTILPE